MSVTFSARGYRSAANDTEAWINLANANAADLLEWLGYPREPLYGSLDARELAARCRRRLWPEARNVDPALPSHVEGRFIFCGRRPAYLRERTAELLAIAERAGDLVDFG